MSSHKTGARSGADGNTRLLAQYGGHRSGRKAYADGGAVNPSLDEGLAAAGDSGMKSSKSDGGGEKKTARTNIVINVNGKDPAPPTGAAGMAPPMPMPMPPPMPPAPPMAGPGGPPMGPGGPPMGPGGPLPMRASGGRVTKRAMGGPVDPRAAAMGPQMSGGIQAPMGPTMAPGLQAGPGIPTASPGLQASYPGRTVQADPVMVGERQESMQPPMQMGRASGGRVDKHSDIKADKAMVKTAVGKHEKAKHPGKPMTKLSVGGPAKAPTESSMLAEKGMQGGGGGAIGRLEKLKKYGK